MFASFFDGWWLIICVPLAIFLGAVHSLHRATRHMDARQTMNMVSIFSRLLSGR